MTTRENQNQEIVLYKSEDGAVSFNVNVFEETVWVTQKEMSQLFDKSIKTISEHIINIFEEKEVDQNSTIRKFRIVQKEGERSIERNVEHYNLDMIISVGYRVKSKRGIQFRQWATKVLKQYMLNGYAVNEVRIRKIESSLDELVSSQKLLKDDVSGIKNLLIKLIERPIVIHSSNSHNHSHSHQITNQVTNQITNQIKIPSEIEERLISLLDLLILNLGGKSSAKAKVRGIKQDVAASNSDSKARSRLFTFFKQIGDKDSDLHKAIEGAGIAKKIVSEIVKIGEKIKDLLQ